MTTRNRDGDEEMLQDGETGRCRMMLRDGVPTRVVDGSGGLSMHRPGFRRLATRDAADGREAAYAAYEDNLTTAWQHDAAPPGSYPYTAAAEGTACTINGAPGVLVRDGNYLVCRPVPRADSRQDHGLTMDAIYQQYDRDLQNCWRGK